MIYRDYRNLPKVRAFAKRHELIFQKFNDPLEGSFLRVWFPDTEKGRKFVARAAALYGRTRGGITA
ncbi:MAG: hypothetical protein JRJ79_17700 [Deltaproteobacteria bacterium]|nr:hypothetical protein [Deltaproteobacteria bacterium]